MSENFDLLGDPIPDGFGKRGRPQHVPTGENRLKVRMLLAFDWDRNRIAKALRITEPTLRKHYFRELAQADEARPALDAALIKTTMTEALSGNASMMKVALKMLQQHDLEKLGLTAPIGGKEKHVKKGKKEQALEDALAPRTDTKLGELISLRQAGKPN